MTKYYIIFAIFSLASFLLTALIVFPLRSLLRRLNITEDGIPTMGGIGFLAVVLLLCFVSRPLYFYPFIILFSGFAIIGIVDDLLKVLGKQKQGLGLWPRLILQTLVAIWFSMLVVNTMHLISMPLILKLFNFHYFWPYLALSVLLIVGGANAAKLGDGRDGLLAGSGAISFACFGYIMMNQLFIENAILTFIVSAGLIGLLLYNFPRRGGATLFVGSTGAFPVGALLVGLAVFTHNELVLFIVAGLFVIQILSLIVQALSKNRVLKAVPLQSHFEALGWSKSKIAVLFWVISLIFGLLGIIVAV